MKIQDSANLSNLAPSTDLAKTAATQSVRSTTGGSGASQTQRTSDQVSLSDFASKISSQLDASAASRAERVSQLAAAYQSGSYQPDLSAVSKSIVDASVGSAAELR